MYTIVKAHFLAKEDLFLLWWDYNLFFYSIIGGMQYEDCWELLSYKIHRKYMLSILIKIVLIYLF
jgi:hypothetical protein